jgi:hypothetical protein
VALCVGLVTLAAVGIGGDNALGVRLWPVLLTLGGTLLVVGGTGERRGAARAREASSG